MARAPKTPAIAAKPPGRFQRASEAIEARYGHWPVWRKLLVGVPLMVLFSAFVVLTLEGINLALITVVHGLHH